MPSLEIDIIEKVLNKKYEKFPVFIETGTANGDTIFAMENKFNILHTIEIYEPLYIRTKNKYNGNKITFHMGDSSEIFKNILPTITDNTIFFLDGHYSGGFTGYGNKHVPLYEELELIMKYFTKKAIIIIDDFRLFTQLDGGICDWTQITKNKCLEIINDRLICNYHLPSSHHPEDRLILELTNI